MSFEFPNETVFIQFLIFLATLFVLNRFVFIPFLAIIEERRKKTTKALQEAEYLTKKTGELNAEWGRKIGIYKDHIRQTKEHLRQEFLRRQQEEIEKKKEALLISLKGAREKIQQESTKSETALQGELDTMVSEIFQKLVKPEG
ncbi:MAG: ATP synthase F0 subunit B [Deltaproteobacteria bacterium]